MGQYLDGAPMGPNVRRLLAAMIATEAVPASSPDGLGAALSYLTDRTKYKEVNQRAIQKVEEALDAVKAAPDNTYGDDEGIAAEILRHIDERQDRR